MSSITGERECQECMFWIPDKTLAKAGEMSRAESRGLYAGQCRRSPPTARRRQPAWLIGFALEILPSTCQASAKSRHTGGPWGSSCRGVRLGAWACARSRGRPATRQASLFEGSCASGSAPASVADVRMRILKPGPAARSNVPQGGVAATKRSVSVAAAVIECSDRGDLGVGKRDRPNSGAGA